MAKADAHWLANGVSLAGATWQNSTFHVGNLAYLDVSGATPNTATQTWAASNDYAVDGGADSDGPNDLGAGEVYLMSGRPDSIRARVASEVAAQNYCALERAHPLGKDRQDQRYRQGRRLQNVVQSAWRR
jgi:hypothetical protein